jgi:hypothetical protein
VSIDRVLEFWLATTPPTGWMNQAACRDRDELPWTANCESISRVRGVAARMRAVCDTCPVRAECERFAVEAEVTGGFWAGRWRSGVQARTRHGRGSDAA